MNIVGCLTLEQIASKTIRLPDGTRVRLNVATDDSGRYSLSIPDALSGPVYIASYEDTRSNPVHINRFYGDPAPRAFYPGVADTVRGIDLHLVHGAVLNIHLSEYDGTPSAKRVYLDDTGNSQYPDVSGIVVFNGVASGHHTFLVRTGIGYEGWDIAVSAAETSVTCSMVLPFDQDTAGYGRLTGTVAGLVSDKDAYAVLLYPNMTPYSGEMVNAGYFDLDYILPGQYYLRIEGNGYRSRYFPGTADSLAASRITIVKDTLVSGLAFTVEEDPLYVQPEEPGYGNITGRVLFSDDSPADSAYVRLENLVYNGNSYTAYCDSLGEYRLDSVDAGYYQVVCDAANGPYFYAPGVLLRDDAGIYHVRSGQLTQIDITIPPGAGMDTLYTLTGRVTETNSGVPLDDILVRADSLSYGSGYYTKTDSAGVYRIVNIPPGEYQVYALPEFGGDYSPSHGGGTPDTFSVKSGVVADTVDLLLERSAVLKGQVRDRFGNGLENVTVTVSAEIFNPLVGGRIPADIDAKTDSAGYYILPGVSTGKYIPWVTQTVGDSFMAMTFFGNTMEFSEAETVNIVSGQDTVTAHFSPVPAAVVTGMVSGLPANVVPEMCAVTALPTAYGSSYLYGISCDSTGSFRFYISWPGKYVIRASGGLLQDVYYPDADDKYSATPLTIAENSSVGPLAFSFSGRSAKGLICGTIRDARDSLRLYGGRIDLFDDVGVQYSNYSYQQVPLASHLVTDGTYCFDGLDAGNYIVCYLPHQTLSYSFDKKIYNDRPFLDTYYPSAWYPHQAGVISVTGEDTLYGRDIYVRTGAGVTGIVRDSYGNVQPGVTVTMSSPQLWKMSSAEVETDDAGRFIIRRLPPGTYVMSVRSEYYPQLGAVLDTVVLTSPDSILERSVTLPVYTPEEMPGGIRVRFATDDGDSVIMLFGYLYLYDEAGSVIGKYLAMEEPEGDRYTVSFPSLKPGKYRLFYRAGVGHYLQKGKNVKEYASQYHNHAADLESATEVTVRAGTWSDVVMMLGTGAAISGTITNVSGDSLRAFAPSLTDENGANVSSYYHAGLKAYMTKTGMYVVSGLCPGTYYLKISASFGDGETYSSLYSGNALQLDQASPVVLTDGDTLRNVDFDFRTRGGYIQGTLFAEDGVTPIDASLVYLYDASSGKAMTDLGYDQLFHSSVNRDGEYRFSRVPPGAYYLKALPQTFEMSEYRDYFIPQYYSNAYGEGAADIVSVGEGDSLTGMDFVFTRGTGGSISGSIINREDDTPVYGRDDFHVELNGQSTGIFLSYPGNQCDGMYRFGSLPPDRYTVRLREANMFFDSVFTEAAARQLVITGDEDIFNVNFKIGYPFDFSEYPQPTEAASDLVVRFFPNPVTLQVTFTPANPTGAVPSAEIYSSFGRLVRRITASGAGGSITWDRRDAAGKKVPSGLYVFRYTVDGKTKTERLLILR